MTLLVEQAALMMRPQDLGRFGFLRYGMPASGPADWWAFHAANRLVNNPPESAELEIGFSDAVLRIESEALIAVCGAGYRILLNDKQLPLWMAFLTRKGDRLFFEKCSRGCWVYLAVSGGILSRKWMGSRSVYSKAGLGRRMKAGDRLLITDGVNIERWLAGRSYPISDRPAYAQDMAVRVIPGPQYQNFTTESQKAFWEQSFLVTNQSDRMGYRLAGTKLSQWRESELVSQGMVRGEIQVPPDGQAIMMMPDHPTTGGYPSIGVVSRVDLPLIAQAQPGISLIQFKQISVKDAQEKLAAAINRINNIEDQQEEQWMNL